MQCCSRGSRQHCTGKNPLQFRLDNIWSLFGDFYFGLIKFLIITGCCKCRANIVQILPTLHRKNPGSTLDKKIRYYGTSTARIKQESSEEKPSISSGKKSKYFTLSFSIMTEDSVTLSLDLANDFPETEKSQTRHKEPIPRTIQAEGKQSNNEMLEILKYIKSEIASLKRKQEALESANPPRLRKFHGLLELSNNDMESECLISEHTSRIETSPEK